MKKIFYIISILAGLYSCEQNLTEEILPQQNPETDERVPMTFQMTFPGLTDYGTDLVPMSRATTKDTIKSLIANEYKAIIIKKIENQWFVDTVIKNQPIQTPGSIWNNLTITKDTAFSPIQINLRPGTYKMGLFLGVNNTDLNPELKKGFLVSSAPDIVAGQNLPAAVFAHIAGPPQPLTNDPPEGTYVIAREIFAGMVNFTVGKDQELQAKGVNTPLNIALQRKVSRYRFLLKQTAELTFDRTPHKLQLILRATDANNPFCNGLDVLGGSYYDLSNPLTEISLLESTTGNFYLSTYDNELYQMAETAGGGGSTNFGPFIIMDKPINFELTVPMFSGQASGPLYECKENLSLTFQPNSLLTNIFITKEPDDPNAEKLPVYYLDDSNANRLFDPYYEWNAKPQR